MASGLLFLLNVSIAPVSAQETIPSPPKTEIIQNEEAGTVSIVIDGKTVGFFTKDVFHVLGDIVYSGTIRDGGSDNVKKIIDENNKSGGADDENQ